MQDCKEIQTAVWYVAKVVAHVLDDLDAIERFKAELTTSLRERFDQHWYIDQPTKGGAYRSLSIRHGRPDRIIVECLRRVGVTNVKLRSESDCNIFVDPGHVSVKPFHGKANVLYSKGGASSSPTHSPAKHGAAARRHRRDAERRTKMNLESLEDRLQRRRTDETTSLSSSSSSSIVNVPLSPPFSPTRDAGAASPPLPISAALSPEFTSSSASSSASSSPAVSPVTSADERAHDVVFRQTATNTHRAPSSSSSSSASPLLYAPRLAATPPPMLAVPHHAPPPPNSYQFALSLHQQQQQLHYHQQQQQQQHQRQQQFFQRHSQHVQTPTPLEQPRVRVLA